MSVKNTTFDPTKEEWAQYIHRRARELRNHQTPDEILLGSVLAPLGFEPQVVVGGRYIVDFLHPDFRIAVEVDGRRHWASMNCRVADAKREKWLRKWGAVSYMFRFTHKDVTGFLFQARDMVAAHIRKHHHLTKP